MSKTSPLRTYLNASGVRPTKVASDLRIDRVTLWRWAASGVPLKRIADVASVTGIPVAELRPDLAAQFAAAPKPNKRKTSSPLAQPSPG